MGEKLPSREECISWLKELKMWDNIFAHVMQVNRIAVFLAEKMREKGIEVDVELVDRASLVHDIDKHLTLKTGNHGFLGKEIIEKKGYPRLAEFCVSHLLTFVLENGFSSIEHKIVFYADKRVNGDKIVSLKERFDYFAGRYGSKSKKALERILSTKPFCLRIEKEIFGPLGISADLGELGAKSGEKEN